MDAFLDFLGLYRSDVAKDGTCLFRAVSEQLFYTQVYHAQLREKCIEYMTRNLHLIEGQTNENPDAYLEKIKDLKEWVGEVEMKALSLRYRFDCIVYYDVSKAPIKVTAPSAKQTVSIACSSGNRYDCVYSKKDLAALAFCQSIVYELLYKRVYNLGSDVDIAVEKMLHDKTYSKQRRNNLLSHMFKESCRIDDNLPEDDQTSKKVSGFEIRKALAQGIPPFPYKVAKTLDSGIYRNVEFDIWNESRKEDQKNEQYVIPKLEPGVKCKVHFNREIYVGYVQDIHNDMDVTVYIEELCRRCVVSINVIEIIPIPAYKALTWQGGKTYKVYSDNSKPVSDKTKVKKIFKKNFQDFSPGQNTPGIPPPKPNNLVRSNSCPASDQHNFFTRNTKFFTSPQAVNNRKRYVNNVPLTNGSKVSPQRNSDNFQSLCSTSNIPHVIWNGIEQQMLPTSPIPIPGKRSDQFRNHPTTPESGTDYHDPCWVENGTSPYGYPPSPFAFAHLISGSSGYSIPHGIALNSNGVVSTGSSMPLPIPGTQSVTSPIAEEAGSSTPQPNAGTPTMALYPYPLYSGMYLVCRDGSAVPVSVAPWNSQDAVAGSEINSTVPSVYLNTPPTGISPPMAQWIPGSVTWTPAISPTAVTFTPPLEVNTYQPLMSPPWSPQTGVFIAPPTPVSYPMPQVQPHEQLRN